MPAKSVIIVAHDPAGAGVNGLAVVRAKRVSPRKLSLSPLLVMDAPIWDRETYYALGKCLGEVLKPGEQCYYAYENDNYGGRNVAKSLGTAIGAIKGLLIDLGALRDLDERVLCTTSKGWRSKLWPGKVPSGRKKLKEKACAHAKKWYSETIGHDAAEALCIAEWAAKTLL